MNLPPRFETALLLDLYRRYSDHLGTNDEAALATPGAQVIIAPSRWKKIGEMIQTKTLHLRLAAAAPTSGILLKDIVVDRSPNMAALTAGFRSPDELAVALSQNGVVVGGSGNYKHFDATLKRRLPARITSKG